MANQDDLNKNDLNQKNNKVDLLHKDIHLSGKAKLIIWIFIIIVSLLFMQRGAKIEAEKQQIAAQVAAKEQAEKKVEDEKKRVELEKQLTKEFSENQEGILSSVTQLFDQEKYSEVIALTNKYAFIHNQQMDEFGQKATNIFKQERAELAQKMKLKKIEKACKDITQENSYLNPSACKNWIFQVCLLSDEGRKVLGFSDKEIKSQHDELMEEFKKNSSNEFKKFNFNLPLTELACLNRFYNQSHK